MPAFRSLDDQSYREILERAKGRLPWLCPAWTDHNPHDPGITLLELIAWYKEMQQYHLNQLTPELRFRLLELAGLTPQPERAARMMVELETDSPARLEDAAVVNGQETVFELCERVPARRMSLKEVDIVHGGTRHDVTALLHGGASFRPFSFFDGTFDLLLGFSGEAQDHLRIWFEISAPGGQARNRPEPDSLPPRGLTWELEGRGEVQPIADETWSLSWSGFITLPAPSDWKPGKGGLRWLRIRQTDPGCEEEVRLNGIFTGYYRAEQRRTLAREHRFRVPGRGKKELLLASAQALEADLAVFLRGKDGWVQRYPIGDRVTPEGRYVTVDCAGAAGEGAENLLVACLDPLRGGELLFDAKGLPGERFPLRLEGRGVLTDRLRAICLTLQDDGTVRPAPWRPVRDLSLCSPRDRVFRYDAQRECLVFGDGEHGAVPAAGEGAVLITELALSRCSGGNVPANARFRFAGDAVPVRNTAASGGREAETPEEVRGRLLKRLEHTQKCLTAEDFADCAMDTPGLRLAGAKALPGYDAGSHRGRRRAACVTVVVLPASEQPRPMPDKRFLQAVDRQLQKYRPVCIYTHAAPPRYIPVSVYARVTVTAEAREETLRAAVEQWMATRAERVGLTLDRDEASNVLAAQPGVLLVNRMEFRSLDENGYVTGAGDLQIPPDGLPYPAAIQIETE